MTFAWPIMLASLVLVPVLVFVYLWVVMRRDAASSVTGLQLTNQGRYGRMRRHVTPLVFALALALLLVSLARPQATLALPRLEGTVILAFDVSTSMQADDLKPSRIEAAKQAAKAFVEKQPETVDVGVVAFSDNAFVMQQPTKVQADVLAAIDRLTPQGGTSLGQGIFASLGAIAGKPLPIPENAKPEDLASADIGHYSSAAIVMLSDGEDLSRTDPTAMAELASGAGVRVFPIGLGKPQGTTLNLDGFHVSTALNEPLLQAIAQTTDGTYIRAENTQQLIDTYKKIDLKMTTKGRETEVTAVFAAAAMLLLCVQAVLTIRWFGRVP